MKRWILLVVLLYCGVCFAQNQDDILIADFEGKTYGDWKVVGEAFGPGPAKGTLAGQMEVSGFEGKGLANTFYKGDDTTGTLTSPPLEIQRKYINFLIGGGMHPGKACINLLVDDKIVRTATGPNDRPGGSEALDWHSWDVSDLGGKTAVIQIVDEATGGWGHINIDHISQSSNKKIAVEKVPESREMVFAKKYLNMPVAHGAAKRTMDILIDGKIVRQFVIELADNEPGYWVSLNVSEFKGKTATLKLNASAGKSNGLEKIYQDDAVKEADTFYKEKNRQQFHFSSRRGWNNDSNGLVYYDGEYHLFYQHNPYGWAWGNMTWGHAVSTDIVHWKELDDAIHPDHLGTIFSGSAVVDEKNTAGFQTGSEKVIVCIYTSAAGTNAWSSGKRFTQSIAYSNDRGRTWTVYEGNPVIEHINGSNRDPKVIWHKPTNQWAMALYLDGGEMAFFTSKDLKSWKLQSKLKCFHECPELFELPVDGDKNNMRWVFYGGSGDYFVGAFDGKEFKPDGKAIGFHSGNCFYASQTFSNIPESDGRRIQIAWGRIATPDMPFNQCMLFPVVLTLHTTEEGIRMFAEPVKEIETLHGRKHSIGTVQLDGEKTLDDLRGELFHITAQFSPADAAEFGLTVRGVPITYNVAKKTLSCKGKNAQLKLKDGKIKLELLIDRNSIEIFANDGRVYMPIGGILPEDNKSIELFTKGGKTKVQALEVYELNSAWR